MFKSRLQEYAQKVGLPTPVYETIKEGPSHEPTFRSTVILSDTRYDSLPGFFNRKAAEQSAAEVALIELSRSGERKECISQPVVSALYLSSVCFSSPFLTHSFSRFPSYYILCQLATQYSGSFWYKFVWTLCWL